ncbi:MAG: hypothetical protein WB586_04525 [Chthoniobacterales bacterium]
MKRNCQVDHDMSRLAGILEVIKELPPDERAALRDWLNGYDGNVLIFSNPLDSSHLGFAKW